MSSFEKKKDMSSRIFQSVIVQMKEATDRCIGIVDYDGFVVACSELSMIGSRVEDVQALAAESQERLFASESRTYKLLGSVNNQYDYAVFVEGDNLESVARFIAEKLSIIDGIVGVQTHFILRKYKIEGQITKKSEESKRQIIQA